MVAVDERAVCVRLSQELYEQLRQYAFDQRRTQVDIIREALTRFFQGQDTP